MNQNVLIGILATVIVLGGAFWLFTSGPLGTSTTATTTAPTTVIVNNPTPTPTTPPVAGAPTATTGTLVVASNASAVVTGKVAPNGAQTSYWYEYGSTSALGQKTDAQTLGSGFGVITAPAFIVGLAPNATYSFRLVAQNNFGASQGAIVTFSTNGNPAPAGSFPKATTDSANAITRTSANLNGRVNPDSANTSIWFEYGVTTDLGTATSFSSIGGGNNLQSETVSVSGLTPATKYYFRVMAQNQFGTVAGSIQNFTTSGPAAITAPSASTSNASNVQRTTATLNGKVTPNGDSTSYWFEYSTDTLLGNLVVATTHKVAAGSGTNPMNVSADVTGLLPNTTYGVRLVALNTIGITHGDIVTFKTKN